MIKDQLPPVLGNLCELEGEERREEEEEEEEKEEEEEEEEDREDQEDKEEKWLSRMQWVRKPRALLQKELSVRLLREGDLVRLCV